MGELSNDQNLNYQMMMIKIMMIKFVFGWTFL